MSLTVFLVALTFGFSVFAASPSEQEATSSVVNESSTGEQTDFGNKITYVRQKKVYENGREILRIELGMAKDNAQYTVSTKPYLKKQLLVNFSDTKAVERVLGSFQPASKLASQITVEEAQKNRGRVIVTINLTGQMVRGSYKVYTLPSSENEKKPTRVIIDIISQPKDESGSAFSPAGAVNATRQGHTVVIDPGHGGSDTGATGYVGSLEKDICLKVAKRLKTALTGSGINVIMTRETDRDVYGAGASATQELQARVNFQTNNPSVEAFVSIHCNAFTNPATDGTETYYYAGAPRGYRLAHLVHSELLSAGGRRDRGVKTANFYVLRHTGVPAVLVELAFITNPQEEQLLSNEQYQTEMANAIARGIVRYFGGR